MTPITVLLAASLATCGWLWIGLINRRLAKKSQAVNLLIEARSEQVNKWKQSVYDYLEKKENAKTDEVIEPPVHDIDKLLGFCEFMSIVVMNGTVDEEIMKESQRIVFKRLYKGLREHIRKAQEDDGTLYCHFTHYARLWNERAPTFEPSYIKKSGDFFEAIDE